LWNIVGRDKASSDYNGYSKTLLTLKGVWTYEDLNTFLSGPAATTPGVNMQVQGAPNEADRVNVIAYLRGLSNRPVPLP
jgi:cytochrome c